MHRRRVVAVLAAVIMMAIGAGVGAWASSASRVTTLTTKNFWISYKDPNSHSTVPCLILQAHSVNSSTGKMEVPPTLMMSCNWEQDHYKP